MGNRILSIYSELSNQSDVAGVEIPSLLAKQSATEIDSMSLDDISAK